MRISTKWIFLGVTVLGLLGCQPNADSQTTFSKRGSADNNSDADAVSEPAGVSGKTVVSSGVAAIGGPFTLIDEKGAVVTEADLLGKPHLIYFGFAYCPDICPTSLQKLGAAEQLLGRAGDDVGYVLFTVDPERDTPEKLAQYVTFDPFPKGLRGFTGSVEQVEAAKAAYKVASTKRAVDGGAAKAGSTDYTVDHSDIIYLMGADGKFADFFSSRSTPRDIDVRVRQELMKAGK